MANADRALSSSQGLPPDLVPLALPYCSLEALSGLDINETFVGGFPLGTFRPSLTQSPRRLMSFWVMQGLALGVFAMISVPVGLVVSRDNQPRAGNIQTANIRTSVFPWVVLGGTIAGMGLWNGWMLSQSRKFRTLNLLLDEVDRYQDVLEVLALYDQLQGLRPQGGDLPGGLSDRDGLGSPPFQADLTSGCVGAGFDREQVLTALGLTRSSLITAFQAERLARQHQRLLDRRPDLVNQLALNLHALTALQVNQQAQESAQVLAEVLEIGQVLRQTFHEAP